MSKKVSTVSQETTIGEMLKLLISKKITGVPVVDPSGKMIGIFSEYDLLKQAAEAKKLDPQFLERKICFTPKVEAIPEDEPLLEIVNRFVGERFRRLPVIDRQGCLVGIITRRDLMKVFYYLARLSEEEF